MSETWVAHQSRLRAIAGDDKYLCWDLQLKDMAAIRAALDRIERLEAALCPFARHAELVEQFPEYCSLDPNPKLQQSVTRCTVGDLRRAREALK